MNARVLKHVFRAYRSVPAVWIAFACELMRSIFFNGIFPMLLAQIIADAFSQGLSNAFPILVVMFGLSIVAGSLGDYFFVTRTDAKYKGLATTFHSRLLSKNLSYFKSKSVGELSTLFRDHMDGTIHLVRFFRKEMLNFGTCLLMPPVILSAYDLLTGVLTLALAIAIVFFTNWSASKVKSLRKDAIKAYKRLSGEVADQLLNIELVKTSGREIEFISKVKDLAQEEASLFGNRHVFETIVEFFKYLAVGLSLIGLLSLVVLRYDGREAVELAVVSILYLNQIYSEALRSPSLFKGFSERVLRVESTLDVLSSANDEEFNPRIHCETPVSLKGDIVFDSVSFGYEMDAPVLDKFSLRIAGGEHVALMGRSGEGKSTITYLLMRLYKIDAGRITIGGSDIYSFPLGKYRLSVSYVPQQSALFNRSIIENVTMFSSDADDQSIRTACDLADATAFIENLPDGLNSGVGQLGTKLSGGQKQRIAIARSLLSKADIFIFDELTSALDDETATSVMKNLKRFLHDKTVIYLTHNKAVAALADRTVFIDGVLSNPRNMRL